MADIRAEDTRNKDPTLHPEADIPEAHPLQVLQAPQVATQVVVVTKVPHNPKLTPTPPSGLMPSIRTKVDKSRLRNFKRLWSMETGVTSAKKLAG